jgi:hypothetical protein
LAVRAKSLRLPTRRGSDLDELRTDPELDDQYVLFPHLRRGRLI